MWRFWIDTGGTFTDCLAEDPAGKSFRIKILSSGAVRGEVTAGTRADRVLVRGLPPAPQGVFVGYELRELSGAVVGRVRGSLGNKTVATFTLEAARDVPPGTLVDLSAGEEAPVLAMRLITGTLLAQRLPPADLRLATTRGTNALLEGKGARVAFFVTEGFGDLLRIGDQRRPDLFALKVVKPPPLHGPVVEVLERIAADGTVVRALDPDSLRSRAQAILAAGINVAAVALVHSSRFPEHERTVVALLREMGFAHVSASAELAPFIKVLPRAETAVVDAVLAPVMEQYLSAVAAAVDGSRFRVMTSAGGLVRRDAYRPKDSLLSGPAGGVGGAAGAARRAGFTRVLTFDMGGTSTDVARWAGDFGYRFEHRVGPARVMAPAVLVESVAAGGGSICRFDGAAFVVGPESAGANPGPACYGAGGPLTLTDINLLLGRLDVSTFAVPVAVAAAETKLAELLTEVQAARGTAPSRQQVLEGFVAIADERMADAMRRISVHEGYDPADHALIAFGGAGGLHACTVAERLHIGRVLFPANSGILSAAGLSEAVPERFAEVQLLELLDAEQPGLETLFARLETEARTRLAADDVGARPLVVRRAELELRWVGQESTLTIAARPLADSATRFLAAYRSCYGYVPDGRDIELVTARVVVSPAAIDPERENFVGRQSVKVGGQSILRRGRLKPGDVIMGPALVADEFSTLWVAPGWTAVVGSKASLLLDRTSHAGTTPTGPAPEVELELFTCRFSALVDDMGGLLQRCALSVNVKERLDFSCALLDADGQLVANAPHIPVHLGALGLCVRRLRECMDMAAGDVVVTNHPAYGGSHLPDVTLVAPVHDQDGNLLGYVANRAHHAEIGGLRPGSMSPEACHLAEEGVVLVPMYLVRSGVSQWDAVRREFLAGPYPSRSVDENLADLHAQLAAIRQGADNLRQLARGEGAPRVCEFMRRLRDRAAAAAAVALGTLPAGPWSARETLDDGTVLSVRCTRRASQPPRICIDFSGTAGVHAGNLNATPAITRSAVLYVLRLLAGADLPLNEGLLRDVDLIVPPGLLAPDFPDDPGRAPAVAGGNVETSQRIVDALLQAWGVAACSQGTMNNLILGTDRISYYETVGGGTGAGAEFAGADAVHSHMTNTAITDPEVLERRLPVRLERFAVRANSGGGGRFPGGAGIERRLRFLAGMSCSLLTQRRTAGPPGLAGGLAGQPGAQWVDRADGSRETLAACVQLEVAPRDALVLMTPGGGGWGAIGGDGCTVLHNAAPGASLAE